MSHLEVNLIQLGCQICHPWPDDMDRFGRLLCLFCLCDLGSGASGYFYIAALKHSNTRDRFGTKVIQIGIIWDKYGFFWISFQHIVELIHPHWCIRRGDKNLCKYLDYTCFMNWPIGTHIIIYRVMLGLYFCRYVMGLCAWWTSISTLWHSARHSISVLY